MSENNSVAGIFSGHGQIKTPTYKEQAYRLIKEAILYQRFQADTIYSQEAICQELGISRTPVREALLELQKELEKIMQDPSRYTDRRNNYRM